MLLERCALKAERWYRWITAHSRSVEDLRDDTTGSLF